MSSNLDKVESEEIERNASASVQRVASASGSEWPMSEGRSEECAEPIRIRRPLIDKILKHGAEEFRATADDDSEKAEFWLENSIWVFDELSCTPTKCLKYAISLLKDIAYHWWNTITLVVPIENVIWEFFQAEFRKKYMSQIFIDQKKKEFLKLKQGNMAVSEYEQEFVQLSKYVREWVLTEVKMCNALKKV
ncbi:uncharacterized protein LOC108462818 [Gossypium arboreum]|uniref:uncharacterized protein LOC108462818 n=1 Tax=Gossypium arboreum TaxID=29729 RepID=UPI00081939EA|nr:uncharacterized protein LOC108462818 [Gossypium arboreum]